MGASYSNLTLRGADRERTIAALQARGRVAFVGPEAAGAFVVFDEASEHRPEDVEALAVELTRELGGTALGVTVHDEDVLAFSLVRDGAVLDRYNSWPGFPSRRDSPTGGDAALLAQTFGAPGSVDEVERILTTPAGSGDYAFETARHGDLVDVLGLPEYAVSLGYGYVYQGDAEELEDELTPVGGAPDAADEDDRDVISLAHERLKRANPEAAAQIDTMGAEMEHPAHGYFRALLAGDAEALRALFAGEPSIDDPATGRVHGEAAIPGHVRQMHDALGTRAGHYVPIALAETPERTVATGRVVLGETGRVAMLPVASVWDRNADGRFTSLRAYYSLGVLTGKRGERAPVVDPASGLALPGVVSTHLAALAADDVQALLGTYHPQCLVMGLVMADPEDRVRGEYGAMLGQDGAVVLQPCTVTAADAACAVEYVTTRWDGSEVPPQAGLALFELRGAKICQVHVFADLGPEPGDTLADGFGFPGMGGGAMPDLGGLMGAFGGGMSGMPGGPGAAGLAGIDAEQMQQLMQGVQQMLNDTLSRPGGAASLLQSLGNLGGLGGLGGPGGGADLGALFGNLGAAGDDEDEDGELEWDFEQDEEDYAEGESDDEHGGEKKP